MSVAESLGGVLGVKFRGQGPMSLIETTRKGLPHQNIKKLDVLSG